MRKIEFLADYPEYISTVAKWIYEEWVDKSKRTLEEETEKVRLKCNKDKLPLIMVAIDNNKCVGAATIFKNDLDTMEYLEPFLGALYVEKEYRGQGIGEELTSKVIEISKELGYDKIYLRTETAAEYYAKRGWKFVIKAKDEKGQETEVFEFII